MTAPVRGATLIGNGIEALSRIDAVGDDLAMKSGFCGKDGQQVPGRHGAADGPDLGDDRRRHRCLTHLEGAARLAVEEALAAGGDEADAWCEDAIERSVRVYDGAVESMTEAGSKGAGVRVFREGRSGYAYGSDLSEEGLRSLARAAAEAASVTEPDEFAGIAPAARAGGSRRAGRTGVSRRGRWSGASSLRWPSSGPLAGADPLVSNVEDTVYADSEGRAALATSNGFCASFEQTQCYAYAYAFAGEGADRMTGIGLAVARGPDGIEPEAGRSRGSRSGRGPAWRAPAAQPPLPGRARSPCRGELRLGDRPARSPPTRSSVAVLCSPARRASRSPIPRCGCSTTASIRRGSRPRRSTARASLSSAPR